MSVEGALLRYGILPDKAGGLAIDGHLTVYGGFNPSIGLGKTFYVDSNNGADTNSGKNPSEALASLDAAIGKCSANRGDVIYALPGHAENISAATSLVCDVAGVTIIGIGSGSLRPKLSHTAAAGVIQISAANVSFKNFVFEAAFADVTEVFNLTAKWFSCQDCAFQDSAADKNFLWIVDTDTTNNSADGLSFINCSWITPDTLTQSWIDVDADLDSLTFIGNYANLGVHTSDLPIIAQVATGKDLTNVNVGYNKLIRLNDANPLLITADTTTANTGMVYNNYIRHLDTDSELLVTAATNIGVFENKASAAVDASGYILPAVDS